MSATKALRRAIAKGMTFAEVQYVRGALQRILDRERNPMVRSSLKQRIAMLDTAWAEGKVG